MVVRPRRATTAGRLLPYPGAVTRSRSRSDDPQAPVEVLMATSKILTAVVSRSLTATGSEVTTPQLRVLVMLSSRGSLNLTAVAQALGVNASNASRTCDQLVTADLVVRREDAQDRRSVALSLSPTGEALVERLMTYRREIFTYIVEEMGPADRAALTRGLTAFVATAAARSASERADHTEDHLLRWLT